MEWWFDILETQMDGWLLELMKGLAVIVLRDEPHRILSNVDIVTVIISNDDIIAVMVISRHLLLL